ncbi:Uncharacterised protein [Gallibacterium anatis]|uniref:Uncharacterized protein n=1 Tax=Gallibacterium anatis TaxID=750 RepID=A0A377H4H5_9PAST|nr:Uncharacterised protein [Gallibacterium anatis]
MLNAYPLCDKSYLHSFGGVIPLRARGSNDFLIEKNDMPCDISFCSKFNGDPVF